MPIDWKPIVDLIHRHQRFLLTTHIRPDGDGIGSILALGYVLEQMGKEVRRVVASSFPSRYRFLDPDQRIERFTKPGDPWRSTETVIVMDTGTWNQLGDFGPFLRDLAVPKIVIDHHETQDDLGGLRLVDTTAEATGRLCFQAIQALGRPLGEKAAEALLVALGMDTGWFRHSNTSAATFTLASELVRAGARPNFIHDQLFENNPLPRLKLTGLVLERLQVPKRGRRGSRVALYGTAEGRRESEFSLPLPSGCRPIGGALWRRRASPRCRSDLPFNAYRDPNARPGGRGFRPRWRLVFFFCPSAFDIPCTTFDIRYSMLAFLPENPGRYLGARNVEQGISNSEGRNSLWNAVRF